MQVRVSVREWVCEKEWQERGGEEGRGRGREGWKPLRAVVRSMGSWCGLLGVPSCTSLARLCLTLCHPMDCSLPGFSVYGILQVRILEWVAIPFSRTSSWPKDLRWVSCIADRFFTIWATKEAQKQTVVYKIVKGQGSTVGHRELYSVSCKNDHGKEYM